MAERPERGENGEGREQGSLEEFREEALEKYGDGEERAGPAPDERQDGVIPEKEGKEPVEPQAGLNSAPAEGELEGDGSAEHTDSPRRLEEEGTVDSQQAPESDPKTEISPDSAEAGQSTEPERDTAEGMQEVHPQAYLAADYQASSEAASGEVAEAAQERSAEIQPIQEPAAPVDEPLKLEPKVNRPRDSGPEGQMVGMPEGPEQFRYEKARPALPEDAVTADESQAAVVEREPNTQGEFSGDEELRAKPEAHDSPSFQSEAQPRAELVSGERVREAVDYGKGVVERFPKTELVDKGFDPDEASKNPIVELRLHDHQDEAEPYKTVFARYVSSDRRAEAYVGGIGGKEGDKFSVAEASEYTEDRFVRDFERNKCEHFENVRLAREEDRLFVEVDNRRVGLEGHRLSASGHRVVLSGKLHGDADFKVEFDGRRESVKFGRGYPVEGLRIEKDELVTRYAQSRSEKHEHRAYLEHLDTSRPALNQFDKKEMRNQVWVKGNPETDEGTYHYVLGKPAQDEIGALLREPPGLGHREFGLIKAEINERLGPNLLEMSGWERIERHPFSRVRKDGASTNGTDWLVRTPDRDLALMEVKWWEDFSMAEKKGESQVAKDLRDHPHYKGERIVRGYVATTEWNIDDSPMRIRIKRVPREGEQRND